MTQQQAPIVSKVKKLAGDPRPYIDISKIVIGKRHREVYSKIPELVQSINTFGMFTAVVVSTRPDGNVDLVAGGRRMRAALMAGWDSVPYCEFETLDELRRKEIELEENERREGLDWQERISNLAAIDEIKKKIYGEAPRGADPNDPIDPTWSLKKTAEMADIPYQTAKVYVGFHKQLVARPDIAERVRNLPIGTALREHARILQAESAQDKVTRGVLKLSNEIQCGDAVELIKAIPNDSQGMLCTDPPFALGGIIDAGEAGHGDVQSYLQTLKPLDNADKPTFQKLMTALAPEWYRVLKPGAHAYIFFGMDQLGFLDALLTAVGFVTDPVPLIWNKGRPTSPSRGYSYMSCYEPILFCHKPNPAITSKPQCRRLAEARMKIIAVDPVPIKQRIHAFQKPEELLTILIKNSTDAGESVLDTCCGSGAVIRAAIRCGRSGVGFEYDKEHWLHAQEFIKE